MQLELVLSNEPRALPSVRALVRETLGQLALPVVDSEELATLVVGAVLDAVENAYPAGEEGMIKLSIKEQHGKLEVLIRDFGVPQDVEALERTLHESAPGATALFGCPAAGCADEMHWQAYGPEGKALQILKWLHVTSIEEQSDAEDIAPFHPDAPLAPPQDYLVGCMTRDEAVQVSQLMYRAYGNTYFNPDVYYPERVAAQNAKGSIISIVARDARGAIAGHCALELNQNGPVAETGQAVVDPAHRGRGLLDRLKEAAVGEAERLNLQGWYGDAVAVHTMTQKSNVTHGGHLTCANLGISPKTEAFRGISTELAQRVTCLLYFHWLKEPAVRMVFVPARHREMVAAIYDNLACPVEFGESNVPLKHGTLAVRLEAGATRAFVRAERLGLDTVHCIRQAKREMVERCGAEVVFVELPLTDPATPRIAEDLEKQGFTFAGVAPHFASRGDLLRLIYLVAPLAREPIKTFEPFADRLVNYALAEQTRVIEAM